jgi:subfamily B ATP-binding cassette protein HlyB/CyaB
MSGAVQESEVSDRHDRPGQSAPVRVAPQSSLTRDHFLWLLGSLCRIHRKPFEPRLVLDQFPPPFTFAALQQALGTLGLDGEPREISPADLQPRQLPAVALLKSDPEPDEATHGETDAAPLDPTLAPALIVRREDDGLVYFGAGSDSPDSVELKAVTDRFQATVLSVQPSAESVPSDELDHQPPRFGFKWFVPELLRHKRIWRDVLIASLFIQLMALATPLFTQVVIDKVIVHHTKNTLVVVGVGLLMFMLFTAAMTWTRQYLVIHTGNRVDAVIGSRVFTHLFRLPVPYFEHRPTGTLIARVQGVETIREFVTGAAVTLLLDLPFLFIFLAVMFYYSWVLTLIVLAVLAAIATVSLLVTPQLRERLNAQFQLGARNQAFLTEYVSGMETVKSLQMEPQLGRRYDGYLAGFLKAGFRTRNLYNAYNVTATTLEQFQTLAILCTGAWLVMQSNTFTVGMLVAFQMFAGRLSQPVMRIVGLWQEFQQAAIAVRRLGDVMDAPAEPYAVAPTRPPADQGGLRIDGLGFRYSEEHPWLYREFNMQVAPGSCVAIMGPSGSGKSTLAKLLQGFYRPEAGRILLDGRNIRHLAANELRRHFGIVPQETVLFSGTLYDNLLMANPHATFEQVVHACRMAEIHEVIDGMPNGYQTEIGEHGSGLSGGQKQRVAIARALLKRPKILVFDESVSNLDNATAEQFSRTINRLKGKVTILFITHQMPQALSVDAVITLGDNRGDPFPMSRRGSMDGDQRVEGTGMETMLETGNSH